MKKETKRAARELAYYSSLGLSVSLAVFIGLAVGVYLDQRRGAPLFFWCWGLSAASATLRS
jgi:hypothetical protein